MMDAQRPANDLSPLPPPGDVETKAILKHAIAANTALARLKGYCALLPNQAILLNTIILKEARASSEIENIVTTHDEVYRALVADPRRVSPDTKEVLNYRAAMWKGFNRLREHGLITTNIIIDIQQELEQNSAGIRSLPGTALKNDSTGEIVYTPPEGEGPIRELLGNLERYMNEDSDIDPLVRMAVAHYQFESIHPFYDGNGRTGRIRNVLFLIKEGLLDTPILYLSRYINRNTPRYYELLQQVRTEQIWERWILFMLQAVDNTAQLTLDNGRASSRATSKDHLLA